MKKYSEIKDQLHTGDVILFHRQEGWRGLVGWIISKVTASPFTHCGIILDVGNRHLLIEAREAIGVTLRPLGDVKKPFKIFQMQDLNKACEDKLIEYLSAHLGHRYDWMGALFAAFRLPMNNKRWYCSEFVGNVLLQVITPDEKEAAKLAVAPTPSIINDFLEKNNFTSFWVQAPKRNKD